MKNNFVGLIILDGYGLNNKKYGNAIKLANPTNIDYYFNNYPFTKLKASGEVVGLPKGQMGNSEVGHMHIGAGRVVNQTLQEINVSIKDKTFFNNNALLSAIRHAVQNDSALHLVGLVSDGGVHSHINHLYALLKMAKQNNVKKLFLHVILDGRDTFRDAGLNQIKELQRVMKNYPTYKIASVGGRFFGMDREKDYSRIKLAYDAIVFGKSEKRFNSAEVGISESYNSNVYDEFIKPFVIDDVMGGVSENDSLIMFNFRADRARQLTHALTSKEFNGFETKKLKNLLVTTFTSYDNAFINLPIAFNKAKVKDNLSYIISQNNLKQFKITETTKYAHVTYFFNGGIEESYENEDRFLIETIKTDRFDETPAMRAREITDKATELIQGNSYDFMVLNYSNCDMIGHTGNLNAAISAVEVINNEIKKLVDSILAVGGTAVILADHGNAEEMLDSKGNILTDHTTNLVPFCIVSNNSNNLKLKKGGSLANVAPTILDLLNLEKPKSFTKSSLLKK